MRLKKTLTIVFAWYVLGFGMNILNAESSDDTIARHQCDLKYHELNTHEVHQTLLGLLDIRCTKNQAHTFYALHCDPHWLRYFYSFERRLPIWINARGLNKSAITLMDMIVSAEHNGLDPSTYHLKEIYNLVRLRENFKPGENMAGAFTVEQAAGIELLLTDAFFSYGLHLSEGRINPVGHDPDWHINKQKKKLANVYDRLLDQGNMNHFVSLLEPRHKGYLGLKKALRKYIRIRESGGWKTISSGRPLKPGDYDNRIRKIKNRLIISGDLTSEKNTRDARFDSSVEAAVKRFQSRYGLVPDGIVGKNTIAAFNISVEDHIRRIQLNMERWRWLPASLGNTYIMVNTAGFEIQVIENQKTVKTMKAIVGKPDRPTPVLSAQITYLKLNPYWNIPHIIALKDILPRIQNNPRYLAHNRIRVFESWHNNAKELNPDRINWSEQNEYTFSYKLQQQPAQSNALGRLKFMFPNEFSVYLHDTPSRYLFEKPQRTFSSGCIRIEKPIELAKYLLRNNTNPYPEDIVETLDSKETKIIYLANPANIHILYWTAWVDEDGRIHFRNDIYEKDHQLDMALNSQAQTHRRAFLSYKEKPYLSAQSKTAESSGKEDIF